MDEGDNARRDALSCAPWWASVDVGGHWRRDGQSVLPALVTRMGGGILPATARNAMWGCWNHDVYRQSVGATRDGRGDVAAIVGETRLWVLLLDHGKEAGNGDVECTWVCIGRR